MFFADGIRSIEDWQEYLREHRYHPLNYVPEFRHRAFDYAHDAVEDTVDALREKNRYVLDRVRSARRPSHRGFIEDRDFEWNRHFGRRADHDDDDK